MTPVAAQARGLPVLDVARVRADFPILQRLARGKPLVYLDNAATTQKPHVVIDAITRYYTEYNANVHRGVHELSEVASEAYEQARRKVAAFFNDREHQPGRARVRPDAGRRRRRGAHLRDGASLEHRAVAAPVRGARRAAASGADERPRRADTR